MKKFHISQYEAANHRFYKANEKTIPINEKELKIVKIKMIKEKIAKKLFESIEIPPVS